jgi:phosphatidylethanolamine/phosphatidyl-N-methylethanolamine N-methyltransferase
MTRHVNHRHGPVIELGRGTGVFARALIAGGLPIYRLALVEADPVFADALMQRYPQARVLRMDAAHLAETLPRFGSERAGAVVSGIPLLSMPLEQVAAIVRGVFERQLQDDGAPYQFTYGPCCPLPRQLLAPLDLEAVRIGNALFNLPPASAYRIGRRRTQRVAA